MVTTLGTRQVLPRAITATRIIAVLRAPVSTHLAEVAVALRDAGVTCIEVTLTTPDALAAIQKLRTTLGDSAEIGAGSVLTVADLEAAIDVGATYTLAPCLDLEVLARAQELRTPHVPGAATPTEIATAWNAGAPAVKVFPAAQLGGPAYLRAVRDPLPEVRLIPTGGVTHAHITDYLDAGAVAVGIGSPLTGRALIDGPDETFHARIITFMDRLRSRKDTTDE